MRLIEAGHTGPVSKTGRGRCSAPRRVRIFFLPTGGTSQDKRRQWKFSIAAVCCFSVLEGLLQAGKNAP